MGSSPREGIYPLWRDGLVSFVRTGQKVRGPSDWSGRATYVDETVRKVGRRQRITVEEAWQQAYDEDGYESGHSYSGAFGSKHGMVVLARNEKLDAVMDEVGTMVSFFNYQGIEWNEDPLKPPKRGKIQCSNCYGSGKKYRADRSGQTDPCPDCGGEGKRLRNAEERAKIRKTIAARKKVLALLGEATLRRIAEVYDDKWGPAAAVVGKDKVWFGGYCSS